MSNHFCSYFDRDVLGVRQMFKRKFGYESTDYPTFESLTREDDLDVEVSCSGYGFTKDEEQDLLHEYGVTDGLSSDDDDDEDDIPEEDETHVEPTADELTALRQQVDQQVLLTTIKPNAPPIKDKVKYDAIASYIQSVASELDGVQFADSPVVDDDLDTFEDAIADIAVVPSPIFVNAPVRMAADADEDAHSLSGHSGVSSTDLQEAQDDVAELDTNSREYRIRMVKQLLSDARSQRSYSTTASTIAPTVIKDRIKKTIELKDQREVRKRCLAKGEANATTRGRKENKDTVKEYAGWDF